MGLEKLSLDCVRAVVAQATDLLKLISFITIFSLDRSNVMEIFSISKTGSVVA
jgi:hypothetical protein